MKRLAVGVLAAGSGLILLSFVVGGALGEAVFVFGSLLFPGALIALSGRHLAHRWRVLLPWGLTVWLEGCAAAIVFGDLSSGGATVVMLLGLGGLPLIAVPLFHAVTFRR